MVIPFIKPGISYYVRLFILHKKCPFFHFPLDLYHSRGQTTQLFHYGITGEVLAPIGGKVSVRTDRGLFLTNKY